MKRALSSQQNGSIKQVLTKFRDADVGVYEAALTKLPEDFVETCKQPCQMAGCIFHEKGYGTRRYTREGVTHRFCLWCDEAALKKATEDPVRARKIRRSLFVWKSSNEDVYAEALNRLPEDFDIKGGSHLCRNSACVFSTRAIGERAQLIRGTDWCAWCDVSVVAARERTDRGRAQIAKALKKFEADPAVLSAAWCQLSPEFTAIPGNIGKMKRERRAMMAEDLVRQCRGRAVVHQTERVRYPICGCVCDESWRDKVKKFEVVAASRAEAAGETTCPIEKDLDMARISFSRDVNVFYWPTWPCERCHKGMHLQFLCSVCGGDICSPGHCTSKVKQPPHSTPYVYSRSDLHVVAVPSHRMEHAAMESNDKLVDMSGPWAAERRLLRQEADRRRESLAMFSEDYVLFEKLFLCVQMDPVGGRTRMLPWTENYTWGDPSMGDAYCPWGKKWLPFEKLEAALDWLRAPAMQDPHICKIFGHGRSRLLELLPGTAALMQELRERKQRNPKCMLLIKKMGGEWCYLSVPELRELGPPTLTPSMFRSGRIPRAFEEEQAKEPFVFWKQQPFPWVQMPEPIAKTIDWLRPRVAREAETVRKPAPTVRAVDDDGIYNTLAMAIQTGSDCSEDDGMRGL